jgi:hypothetical protein
MLVTRREPPVSLQARSRSFCVGLSAVQPSVYTVWYVNHPKAAVIPTNAKSCVVRLVDASACATGFTGATASSLALRGVGAEILGAGGASGSLEGDRGAGAALVTDFLEGVLLAARCGVFARGVGGAGDLDVGFAARLPRARAGDADFSRAARAICRIYA